ncbi:MAG TPA: hypothetical protein VHQ24_14520, partial [Lachnospiraceae bacterium]|nr:hypothetical protein [Lachnospiraceae bacterium]
WVPVGNPGFSAGEVFFTSIAIDSNNVPYVAYQDAANQLRVTVMKFNGVSWVTVGNAGFSPSSASDVTITLDNNNVPYIAYHDVNKNVIVMKYTGTSWVTLGCPISGEQSLEELIRAILAEQAGMARCLRNFFCETLQEISDDKCLSTEKKIHLANELFCAVSEKDSSLVEVIEAASKFRG